MALLRCLQRGYMRLRKHIREKSYQPKRRVDVFKGTAELKSGITTCHKPVGRWVEWASILVTVARGGQAEWEITENFDSKKKIETVAMLEFQLWCQQEQYKIKGHFSCPLYYLHVIVFYRKPWIYPLTSASSLDSGLRLPITFMI